ncbi:MAG TPA: sigma-70 family RNA polymerase sigma factor [Bacteroidota bacterium]|nr:sigma-70 family RNA polymerase sigma factor [Bacteroidota bacterium]
MAAKVRQIRNAQEDLELIRTAKQGDEQSFTKIVKKYEPLVFSFAYKVCRDREKAEETLQDTFVNVYRKLHQFDGKAKFSTWLYSIVVNNCKMKHRKTKLAQASHSLDGSEISLDHHTGEIRTLELQSHRASPLELVMDDELQRRLDEAIRKLPLEYRVVFVLRDIEGKSSEETAKILKLSVPAVKSRLRRARLFLREQLKDYIEV